MANIEYYINFKSGLGRGKVNKISSNPVNDLWNARPVLAFTLLVVYVARNSRSLPAQAQATILQDVQVIFNHSERRWVSFVSNHIKTMSVRTGLCLASMSRTLC